MTLHGTFSADSIEGIVDAISHAHNNLMIFEKMLGGNLIGIKTISWKGKSPI